MALTTIKNPGALMGRATKVSRAQVDALEYSQRRMLRTDCAIQDKLVVEEYEFRTYMYV